MFARAPIAVIDIGSNSVRLVVYSGAKRIPSIIFNEKVMAGLGRNVVEQGTLGPEAVQRALRALERFALLTRQMGVVRTLVVATAAVRDASDGEEFLDQVRSIGFEPTILSGDEEGRIAGLGVVSAIPDADGIVGDLGGGSLELVRVRDGEAGRRASLPLGVLRLDRIAEAGDKGFRRAVADAVRKAGLAKAADGKPFYLVGGSWRSMAALDIHLSDHPLPIMQQHEMAVERPGELRRALKAMDRDQLRAIKSISSSRIPSLGRATELLEGLVTILTPERLIVSSFGIREGLLYDDLAPSVRALDPLIEATREAGAGLGRFEQHGDQLDSWIAPAFDDSSRRARLRLAACLLADIAWAAHPDFRAERGIDLALHGNWVAVDAPGRVMLAQALFSALGGGRDLPYPQIASLCTRADLDRAFAWGLAMRLGQRLSGGVAAGLARTRLDRKGNALRLSFEPGSGALLGESVERRMKTLAAALDLRPETSLAA